MGFLKKLLGKRRAGSSGESSGDFLQDVLRDFSAPKSFREVHVRCSKCGSVNRIPADTYRQVVSNLGLGFNCSCGNFVSMVRKGDDVKFV